MVSIIIRTKDREFFLKRALESISGQTCKDLEAIIVNSSENPLQLDASRFPYPIRILEKSGEVTLAKAINKGILDAEGDWITLLDDDDTWEKEYLQKHLEYLEVHKDCRASASLTSLVLEKMEAGELLEVEKKPFNKNLCTSHACLLYHNRFTTNAFVFSRKAALEIGLYDENLNELEDWDFNLRFSKAFRIGALPEYLSNYHKRLEYGNLGSMANTSIDRHLKADRKVRGKYLHNRKNGPGSKMLLVAYGALVALKGRIRRVLTWLRR